MNRIKENCRYFSFYKVVIRQPIKCKTDFLKKIKIKDMIPFGENHSPTPKDTTTQIS